MKNSLVSQTLKMLALVAVSAAPMVASQTAHADVAQLNGKDGRNAPAWTCVMNFAGKAGGLQVGLGHFEMKAKGDLNCVSITGEQLKLPVKLDFDAKPLELRVAAGAYRMDGVSASIALFTGEPEDILGRYYLAQIQGSLLAGAGVLAATHVGFPDITLQLSLEFTRGLGFNIGVDRMTVTLDEARL